MVLIIQEPRAHQPEGQEIVPFEDLVDFGDGEKNVAFLIKKTYEKKARLRVSVSSDASSRCGGTPRCVAPSLRLSLIHI